MLNYYGELPLDVSFTSLWDMIGHAVSFDVKLLYMYVEFFPSKYINDALKFWGALI